MSRHTIPRERNYGSLVVGYDRPLDHFFVQVWSRQGSMMNSFVVHDIDTVKACITGHRGRVPDPALFDCLTAEAEGRSDTNTCKDWRTT